MASTYIPLYRKYRPQTFHDLIGQENIVKALSNAINLDKIAHAYLLCGPRGTGKTSSARILAKSLNCKEGPTLEPCGKCPSCLDIINGVPVDVIEIDAASNRSVEDTQAILEKIQYVPINGRYKIYVIDEVHMLSNHAFNALLKTLEEPPENVIFILATTEPHKVLETIISRCQRFDFRRITTDDIVKRLEFIAKEENINISNEALYSIAKNSAGGMRDALALLDQISVLGQNKEISTQDIDELLGKISYEMLFDIGETISKSDANTAIALIDKIYNKGNEPIQVVTNLIQYFRDLLILKSCSDKGLVLSLTRINEANFDKIKTQTEKFEQEQVIALIDKLSYYATQIKETTDKYLWLELCLIDIVSNVSYYKISELTKRVDILEDKLASGNIKPSATQVKQAAKPVNQEIPVQKPVEVKPQEKTLPPKAEEKDNQEPSIETEAAQNHTANDINSEWKALVQYIESMPSKIFFQSLAKPVELSKDKIVITFAKDIFVKQAKDDIKQKPLKQAAMTYYNVNDINIEIHLQGNVATASKSKTSSGTTNPVEKASKDTHKEEENEYLEQFAKKTASVDYSYVDKSDQERMVLQLFDGKTIE